MLGRRVRADTDGFLKDLTQHGDYGRVELRAEQVHYCLDQLYWQVITPAGEHITLSPGHYVVIEHADRTISVYPDIQTHDWAGWLRDGSWVTKISTPNQ